MRVLHVASFSGNAGDGANHQGLYRSFANYVTDEAEFVPCEMRQFYQSWRQRTFDDGFVREANGYDLLVFGGGNFLEAKWGASASGTTIDIAPDVLAKIAVPILVYGMGFDDTKEGTTDETISKCKAFLDVLADSPRAHVVFRNDGSRALLARRYGDTYAKRFAVAPDGGFFCELKDAPFDSGKRVVALCAACDMAEKRFEGRGYDRFVEELALWCEDLLKDYGDVKLRLVPHVYSDLSMISDVVGALPDSLRRMRVEVAPLCVGDMWTASETLRYYSDCTLVVSMRFHGNVVPMGNLIPAIGLVSFEKHALLFDEIGLSDNRVLSTDVRLWEPLRSKVDSVLGNHARFVDELREVRRVLHEDNEETFARIRDWLMG